MADGPTTMNGPLHTDEASLEDRKITAFFSTNDLAIAAREKLVSAGIPASSIAVGDVGSGAGTLGPADATILGKVREAILPDDGQTGARAAARNAEVAMEVAVAEQDVDRVVAIIQASGPSHFDADLERWRNSQPQP